MHRIKLYSITLYFIVLFSFTSHSTTWDNTYIETFAKKYLEEILLPPVGGKISISIANIDPRITIKPCQQKLIANIPENTTSRNVNVKISCADSTPWQIYLPARIEKIFGIIIVTNSTLNHQLGNRLRNRQLLR